jgi:endonuclease III
MIKTDHPGFAKDDTRGRAQAVLNIDNVSYTAYKEARAKERQLSDVINEVGTLKQDINDIKSLLANIVSKLNGNNNG